MDIEWIRRSRKELGITSLPCTSRACRKNGRQGALRGSGTVCEAAGFEGGGSECVLGLEKGM